MKKQSTAGRRGTVSAESAKLDLGLLQRGLLDEKTSLLNKALEFRQYGLGSNVRRSDDADQVSFELDMNSSLTMLEKDRTKVAQIDLALDRIRNGKFGMCLICDEKISPQRIMAHPLATLCVQCQEDQELPELQ